MTFLRHDIRHRFLQALSLATLLTVGTATAQTTYEVELGSSTVFTTEPCAGCTCIWYLDGLEEASEGGRLEVDWDEIGDHTVSVQFAWENCYSPLTDYEVHVKETPRDPLVPPPFFTPNGDGENDTWEIEGIASWPEADIRIYNRFHKLIAHYRGSESGWNGTYAGHPCDSDDYWYLITYDDGRQKLTGHVTLKR